MARSQAQLDLDRRIAGTAKDAARVGDAMRLFPMVLLRHDDRVQRAYDIWLARAGRYEEAGQFTENAALGSLFADSVQLNELVRTLHLQRYQSWLPAMLRWEFQRAIEGAPQVVVTTDAFHIARRQNLDAMEALARGAAEHLRTFTALEAAEFDRLQDEIRAMAGRAPKRGASHCEDLERYLTWFYRHQVKQPPDSKYALQREYMEARRREGVTITTAKAQVNNGLKRAEQLLACINAPLPQ